MDELLGEALVTVLRANASVAGLVGERIFPRRYPQGKKFPAIKYGDGARTEFVKNLDGSQQDAVTTLTMACGATSDSAAKQLARAVRTALHGYRGTVAGLRIDRLMVPAQSSGDFVPKDDGNDSGYFAETLEITVHYVVTTV